MEPLVHTSSHSPKHYGRDMQVRLLEIHHQVRKWVTPLVIFGFKSQQQPQPRPHILRKTEKILNHYSIAIIRAKTWVKYHKETKKITRRKIPVTNNKVLVRTGSLLFFKKYRQPIIKFWSVPVPVRETIIKTETDQDGRILNNKNRNRSGR